MNVTDRQRRIIELVACGWSSHQIGAELYLSEYTVKTALKRLFAKFEATNRAHLVHRCYQLGVLAPHPTTQPGFFPTVAQMIGGGR